MGIEGNIETPGPILARNAASDLDCETAALLRAAIRPLFASAASWASLADILRDKGYRLEFRSGRLCVTDRMTGDRVCGLRFLGFEFIDLVRRMGRPIVVARGSDMNGDVLRTRPTSGAT